MSYQDATNFYNLHQDLDGPYMAPLVLLQRRIVDWFSWLRSSTWSRSSVLPGVVEGEEGTTTLVEANREILLVGFLVAGLFCPS